MSADRATAIHEAGHGAMAFMLGRPFKTISVIPDEQTMGRVESAFPGDWFRPDITVDGRTRTLIEDRVMIALAGSETEAAWYARRDDAPAGWEQMVSDGGAMDRDNAVWLAGYMCGGSVHELEPYLEWLRQRVIGIAGRGPGYEAAAGEHEVIVRRQRLGDDRFWVLTEALADAVAESGTLPWRRARAVLRDAQARWLGHAASVRVTGGIDGAALAAMCSPEWR